MTKLPLGCAAIIICLVTLTAGATAQTIGSVELVAQSSWVDNEGIFNAQVRVAGADSDATVVVTIFQPWVERDDLLRQDLSGLEPVLQLDPIVLSEQQDTSNEVLAIEIEIGEPSPPGGTPETAVDDEFDDVLPRLETDGSPAVHPVQIALIDPDGTVIDTELTSIIQLPLRTGFAPLQTAIILEAPDASSIDPTGQSRLTEDEIEELGTLVDAIDQHLDAEVALSITAETVLALERSDEPRAAAILDTMRSRFGPEQLIANPFANVEEQAWVDADLTDELSTLYEIGTQEIVRVVGIEPEQSVMLLDRTATSSGLEYFAERGIGGVVVRPGQLAPLSRETFPQALTTRFLIPAGTSELVPALVADNGLANHFTSDDGTAIRANRLLADLTMLAMQNADVRQAVVVNPPESWEPEPSFLNIILSGLERIPAVEGASPLDALSNTAFTPSRGIGTLSPPLRRSLNPRRQPVDLRSYRTDFSQARSAIASWTTVIASDRPSTERLDELLFLSSNASLADAERQAYIDEVYRVIDEQKTDSITTPASETITLTGRRSDVPIVVDNNLTVEASVLLLLDSEKLAFPEGRELNVTLAPGSNRIDVPIEARASGDSPLRIQVFSPDRSVLLGSSEILIRTFVFSGIGVIIGAIAFVVLLMWWLRHIRASRVTVDEILPAPASETTEEPLGV